MDIRVQTARAQALLKVAGARARSELSPAPRASDRLATEVACRPCPWVELGSNSQAFGEDLERLLKPEVGHRNRPRGRCAIPV